MGVAALLACAPAANAANVYVANSGAASRVAVLGRADGALTALSPATVAALNGSDDVVVDATGRFAYVAKQRRHAVDRPVHGRCRRCADGDRRRLRPGRDRPEYTSR